MRAGENSMIDNFEHREDNDALNAILKQLRFKVLAKISRRGGYLSMPSIKPVGNDMSDNADAINRAFRRVIE